MAGGHDDQCHGIHALGLQLGHHGSDIARARFGNDMQDIVHLGFGRGGRAIGDIFG